MTINSSTLCYSSSGANITVEDDNSASGSYTANSEFLQLTRRTLFRCIAAHSIATSDSVDDLIRPTNISYWKRGDICGKTLDSCKTRYGHRPEVGGSLITVQAAINTTTGLRQTGSRLYWRTYSYNFWRWWFRSNRNCKCCRRSSNNLYNYKCRKRIHF